MKKSIVGICLMWVLLSYCEIRHVSDWMDKVEFQWTVLLEKVAPFSHLPLSTFVFIIALFTAASETSSRQSRRTPWIVYLKEHFLSENGRVLSMVSKTPTNTNAATNDYLQDICFIERRFNGWLLISLVMLVILGGAVWLIAETEAPAVGIPFVIVALVLLFNLLKGTLTVGTADGDVMIVRTNKITATNVCSALTSADHRGFHEVSLSSPFTEKTVHMRKSLITGVAALSQFPFFFFFLFLASAVGAFLVFEDAPFAFIAPVVLLGIVIYLARRRMTVKLIGGHYCYLGSRETCTNVLTVTTPEK